MNLAPVIMQSGYSSAYSGFASGKFGGNVKLGSGSKLRPVSFASFSMTVEYSSTLPVGVRNLKPGLLVLLRYVGNLQVLHLFAEVAELHAEGRHLVVHHVLVLRTPPLVGEAKALGKPVPEFVVVAEIDVGAAFEALEDGHAAGHAHLLDVHGRVADAAALEPRCRGQHVVGQRRRRRHEVIVNDEQVNGSSAPHAQASCC